MESISINLILLPLAIFFIRIIDVSLGTIRIIFINRGVKVVSALLGFVEILVWLFAVTQIIQNLNSPIHYIAYAAGFGMGNFVGVSIEKKLSYGHRIITIITQIDSTKLIESFKRLKYGVTVIRGEGKNGPVKIIFSIVKKNQVARAIEAIKQFNPNAFYTMEDIKMVREDVYEGENKKTKLSAIGRAFFQKRK